MINHVALASKIVPAALIAFGIFSAFSCTDIAQGATVEPTGKMSAIDLADLKADKIIDLTHALAPGIPEFHDRQDAFEYSYTFTYDKDGFAAGRFTMNEHLGTHVDAPSHYGKGKTSVDLIAVSKFILPCFVIDVRAESAANPDYQLTLEKIKQVEAEGAIPHGAAVLLLTGWGERWSSSKSYRNADGKGVMHFPGYSLEAAKYLTKERHAEVLATDTLSLDPGNSTEFPVHFQILPTLSYGIENLDNLAKLPTRGAFIICAPLKIKDGTGGPARVMAVLP